MTSIYREIPRIRLVSLCTVAVWLAAGASAGAQQEPLSTIRGELHYGGTLVCCEQTVDIEAVGAGASVFRIPVRADGTFDARDIPSGIYHVSVTDSRGEVIWRDMVPVAAGTRPLIIQLAPTAREPNRAETVSVARLRQKPSGAALRELKLAEKSNRHGRTLEEIEHLQRAVELAPALPDAHNNLGARYLQSGDYQSARRELEAAVALDPDASIPHVNLALANLALGRSPEAEAEARLALRRDPLSAGANFAAGAALDRQGKQGEALVYLERAGDRVPHALLLEARILQARSQTREAAARLRSYLARPDVPKRAEVARWLATLQAPPAR